MAITPVVAVSAVLPTTFKEAGFNQATHDDGAQGIARWVMSQVAGFPDSDLPEHALEGLKEGYAQWFHANNKNLKGDRVFGLVNGHWVFEANLPKGAKPTDSVRLNLHVALGYSNHEFGRLHETRDAEFKVLIKEYRDAFSDFASQKIRRLTTLAKDIKAAEKGEKRVRAPNKEFAVYWREQVDKADKRLRNAVSSKNASDADLKRFREAVAAFNKVWTS